MYPNNMYNAAMAMSKPERQEAIRRIVRSQAVATQDQLLAALRKSGIAVNQATLSRDLAEVGIRKTGGRYVPTTPARALDDEKIRLAAAVRSFRSCGPHLIVVRTAVGQAQPVALAIDASGDPAFAGTVAGDDTLFVATKNRRSQTVALRRLEQWFGDKHGR